MAITRAIEGQGAFQWNLGAWFGSLIGSTAWLVVGAAAMATRAPALTAAWLACFASAIGTGCWLWRRRDRIRPYPAIQGLLLTVGVAGLLAFAALDAIGPAEVIRTLGTPRQGYRSMLIVPGLMAWFALLERTARAGRQKGDPT